MKTSVQCERGFTLLELLISMVLLGLILVLLFGGLRLGMRSWDAAQGNIDTMSTVRAVESFLRREMGQIYPYRWKKTTDPRLAFHGERYLMRFVAPLPSRLGIGGLYLVALDFERKEEEIRIVWKHQPLGPGGQEEFSTISEAKEMVLAAAESSNVEDIWLTYFGAETEGAEPRWLDRWDNDKRLPLLIRMQVRLPRGEVWPDFVVAPMLIAETAG